MKTRLKNPDGTWEDVELPPGSDIPIDGGDTGVSCWPPDFTAHPRTEANDIIVSGDMLALAWIKPGRR